MDMNFINRYFSAPTNLQGGYLRKEPAVKPVEPIVEVEVDVPPFMKKPLKPAPKPVVKQGKMTFAQILAEAERILNN